MQDFPQGIYKKTIYRKISKLDFEKITANPTVENWRRFIQKYPDSPLSSEARYRLDSQLLPRFKEIQKRDNPGDYREFVQQYPESGFVHYCKKRIARIGNPQKKIKLKYRGYITPIKSRIISKLKNADFQIVYSGNDYDAICEVYLTRGGSGGPTTRIDDYGSYKIKTTTYTISTGGGTIDWVNGSIRLPGKGKVFSFSDGGISILDGIAARYLQGEKKYLKEALRSSKKGIMNLAAAHLSKIGNFHDADILMSALPKVDIRFKELAKYILNRTGKLKDNRAVLPLLRLEEKGNTELLESTLEALKEIGNPIALDLALKIFNRFKFSRDRKSGKILRQAIEAMGKFADPGSVDPLINLISTKGYDEYVYYAAFSALSRIGDKRAIQPIMDAMTIIPALDLEEYIQAANAFTVFKDEGTIHWLLKHLGSNRQVDGALVEAILAFGKKAVIPLSQLLITTKNSLVVDLTARMLGRLKDSRAVDALLEKLESKDNIYYVIIALGEIGDPRAIDPLVKILESTDCREIDLEKAIEALGKIKTGAVIDPLTHKLKDHRTKIRSAAISALGMTGNRAAIQPLRDMIKKATKEEQKKIVRALANIKDKDVIDILVDMMDIAPDANDVEILLDRLTGESFGRDKKLWKQWWQQSQETFRFKE